MPVSIAGKVFKDVSNDGIQQGVDPSLSGVTMNLAGTDWMGNAVSRTITTDATGAYGFTSLPPGTYTVTDRPSRVGRPMASPRQSAAVTNGTAGTATAVTTLPSVISVFSCRWEPIR